MVEFFAQRVILGKAPFSQVPAKLKNGVRNYSSYLTISFSLVRMKNE